MKIRGVFIRIRSCSLDVHHSSWPHRNGIFDVTIKRPLLSTEPIGGSRIAGTVGNSGLWRDSKPRPSTLPFDCTSIDVVTAVVSWYSGHFHFGSLHALTKSGTIPRVSRTITECAASRVFLGRAHHCHRAVYFRFEPQELEVLSVN
jgi:hypothetical protein